MKYINFVLFAVTLIMTASVSADHSIQYDIRVDGITCPFCIASSEKALGNVEGIQAISTNLELGVMTVCAEPSVELKEDELRSMYLEQGFTYRSLSKSAGCNLSDINHDQHKAHTLNDEE